MEDNRIEAFDDGLLVSSDLELKGGGNGLTENFEIKRYFTQEGKSPFAFDIKGNSINWVRDDVKITDDKGNLAFIQPNVKRPDFWSQLAMKVVASKYFWGNMDKGEREDSVEKLIGRVSSWMGQQAYEQGYFDEKQGLILRDEISSICVNQICSFNSPVWFNVGIQSYDPIAGGVSSYVWDSESKKVIPAKKNMNRPQCSACFIQGVEDNMESIMAIQVAEANLFKAGSGTGSNRSPLRSSKETLTGGGKPSGPVSFIKAYDSYAGVIRSGGKTRRAAKMEILNIDHPDVMDFINCKQKEEKKAWSLIEQGYDGKFDGEAYGSVSFQNCNLSVRVTDDFMKAVKDDSEWWTKEVTTGNKCEKFKAREMMQSIAEGTHICGDPGIQCDTIINKYHTCKNSGKINASNPCSEYMFLDDTACNLASINLMKFRTADGGFEVEKFKQVIRNFITVMDLIIDGASYPTVKIAENSHRFRTLGLGYANLGALLMSYGLPYDSDEGRAVAAAITAIVGGEAYRTSAKLAGLVGPFSGYEDNKEPMLKVIGMHRDHVKDIDVEKIPVNLRDLVNVGWDCWSEAYDLGEKVGFRNAQVTVLAPTGTCSFMMDCDTTGIEPDIALVKYKILFDGGMLKIVNQSVGLGLKTLGYSEDIVNGIIDYIDKNDTIEGAPGLKDKHLPVFDCAFKAANGKRAIHYKGHIGMMSAAQPFLSGAISKTVNLPEDASVEDIMGAYIYAWEIGLKAVAIYRENSKRSQPLNTQKGDGGKVVEEIKVERKQNDLPQTRKSVTHRFDIAGHKGYLTVGLYDNGKPGEIFVTMAKEGSTIGGLMDAWARSVSFNLQYGVPADVLFKGFRHQKFEPSGFTKNVVGGKLDKETIPIRSASSIVDYVAQFMLTNFGMGAGKVEFEVKQLEKPTEEQRALEDFGNEGLTCSLCGGPAKRIGGCSMFCTSCKQTIRSGCGE